MITIVEPQELIDKVWGKQKIHEGDAYRLMRYVLRVDHEDKVLLHNVVTGRLVVLDGEEAEALANLPAAYSPVMEQLVTDHYLVPENYDEHQQAVNLRNILWKLVEAQSSKDITYYTILPTTACNARCWYCYEKSITPVTMTEKTAFDVADFIARSCCGKAVMIRWFGGEPTVAAHRIDQISQRLLDCGIEYTSTVTSNGYLFDEEMVMKAKSLWHTKQVNISIDGTEETYNRVKAFSGVKDNPYQRMMRNAELLLANGIDVVIRMNYDRETWTDFPKLLQEAQERFHEYQRWMIYSHQINVDIPPSIRSEMDDWLDQKNEELAYMAKTHGHYAVKEHMPSLHYRICEAGDDSCATILPDGKLTCCPEQIGEDQVKGSIYQGITNQKLAASWKEFADHKSCRECTMFPFCTRLVNCSSKDRCTSKHMIFNTVRESMIACYNTRKQRL